MSNGAGPGAMFSCITGASSHKLLHFLDALDLRRIQMIICHAIRLSHETHVHWFILAMLAVGPIPIETHDVPLYLSVSILSIISTDMRFSYTFAAVMDYSQMPGNPTSNISSLGNIATFKPNIFH